MLNLSALGKLKSGWNKVKSNHPKLDEFLFNLKNKEVVPGQEIAIAIRYPDGTELKTGIRIKEDDVEFVEAVKSLTNSMM